MNKQDLLRIKQLINNEINETYNLVKSYYTNICDNIIKIINDSNIEIDNTPENIDMNVELLLMNKILYDATSNNT